MKADELKQKALIVFSQHGYEGASLSLIAEEAGIKKQSIYSHYKSKDDLFLQTAEDVFQHEMDHAIASLKTKSAEDIHSRLYAYLTDCMERYEKNAETKFWLRTAFFPPEHMYKELMTQVYNHLDVLEAALFELFEGARIVTDSRQAAIAYLGVLDSLFVEMLYGGKDRSQKRLDASWSIFWKGIH
ncbi:TetR/AcrR family transcriptional regulator [Metabacillus sp. 84]|uniref:TetR/AcrR family transcriptional regulator n=1 Tax=unclassified Metabacillus TaxID=2675274 RepID=UPI003CF4DC09